MGNPDWLSDLMARIQETIDKQGWHAIGVFGSENSAPFTYTIGRWLAGRPELVISGPSNTGAHHILHNYIDQVAQEEPIPGERIYGPLLHDYPITTIEVPKEVIRANFGMAYNYYGNWDFPARQIVLPDKGKRFPGELGFDEATTLSQRLSGPEYPLYVPLRGGTSVT